MQATNAVSTAEMENKPVLLAVMAHPDDESFGIGGTLALYAKRKVDVYLVCATRGEAAEIEQKYLEGYASIGELRTAELRCAAEVLGLRGIYFLDYRDSGMNGSKDNQHPQALVNAPLDVVAGKVAVFIRQLQPQVVITFDPIGGYMHPDHIMTHQAMLKAFELARDPGYQYAEGLPPFQVQKMYYHILPKRMMRLLVNLMRIFRRDPSKVGKNKDIDLAALVEKGDFPAHAKIDVSQVIRQREAAALCHASQLAGDVPRRGLLAWLMRLVDRREHYMRAYPPVSGNLKEHDLFEGVRCTPQVPVS